MTGLSGIFIAIAVLVFFFTLSYGKYLETYLKVHHRDIYDEVTGWLWFGPGHENFTRWFSFLFSTTGDQDASVKKMKAHLKLLWVSIAVLIGIHIFWLLWNS